MGKTKVKEFRDSSRPSKTKEKTPSKPKRNPTRNSTAPLDTLDQLKSSGSWGLNQHRPRDIRNDFCVRSRNHADSGHHPEKANQEITKTTTPQGYSTLQCTIGCELNGLTVKDISWRASKFPKSGTYIKLYVLTEGIYCNKKKRTEVEKKEENGERKYEKDLKIQCTEKDSSLILSVWASERLNKPIGRVCIQLQNMEKGRFYKVRCPLKVCTKYDVKTDDTNYFELNQEETEDIGENYNNQVYRQIPDKDDKFLYVRPYPTSLPNTVTGRTVHRHQRSPNKTQGQSYSPYPPAGPPNNPIWSRKNSRATHPSNGSYIPKVEMVTFQTVKSLKVQTNNTAHEKLQPKKGTPMETPMGTPKQEASTTFNSSNNSSVSENMEKVVNRPKRKANNVQSENGQNHVPHHPEGQKWTSSETYFPLSDPTIAGEINETQSENEHPLEGQQKKTTLSPRNSTTLRDTAVSGQINKTQSENEHPLVGQQKKTTLSPRNSTTLRDTAVSGQNTTPTDNDNTNLEKTAAADKARESDQFHSVHHEISAENNEKKYPQYNEYPGSSANDNSEGKSHITRVSTQIASSPQNKNDNNPRGRTPSDRPHETGIPNLRNTCFANSVLQVLGKSPSLQSCLDNCQRGSGAMLKRILTELNTPGNRCVDYEIVRGLLRSVFKRDDSFKIGRQDDSHAFFLSLINCVQEDSDGNPCDIFEGMMMNRFRYNTCDHEEHTDEQRFTSLLMPIANQKNLHACIKDFCREETFEKNDLPCRVCEETHPDTVATKQIVFTKLPMLVVLQMGRFEEYVEYRAKRIRKNNATIKFSNEIKLDEQGKSVPYDLYGVVDHHGSIHGGHYTATVRLGNRWYYCSDTCVSTGANPTINPNGDAYLLFYSRKEDGNMQDVIISHL